MDVSRPARQPAVEIWRLELVELCFFGWNQWFGASEFVANERQRRPFSQTEESLYFLKRNRRKIAERDRRRIEASLFHDWIRSRDRSRLD